MSDIAVRVVDDFEIFTYAVRDDFCGWFTEHVRLARHAADALRRRPSPPLQYSTTDTLLIVSLALPPTEKRRSTR